MSMFFLLLCTFLFIYLVLSTIFSAFLPLFLFIYVRNRLHIDDYLSKKYSYLKTQKQDGYISSSLFFVAKSKKKQSTGKPIPCFISLFFCYFFSISDPLRINFVSTRLVCFRTLFLPSSIDRTLISNNSSAAQPIS